jgi:hypothetical protein
MAFYSDLRAGYFTIQFNMSWLDIALDEMGYKIEVLDEDGGDSSQVRYERFVNRAVEKYVISKIFCQDGEENKKIASCYESIWHYLLEELQEWANKKNPHIIVQKIDTDNE